MKASTVLSAASLVIALAALAISIRKPMPSLTEADIDRRVDVALVRKERLYVQAMTPKMNLIYKDMVRDYKPSAKPPETFVELFLPALQIINQMQSQ